MKRMECKLINQNVRKLSEKTESENKIKYETIHNMLSYTYYVINITCSSFGAALIALLVAALLANNNASLQ